jgi:CBS domain-containing protein
MCCQFAGGTVRTLGGLQAAMRVSDIMSKTVVTCDVGARLYDAAERMLRERVGSVVVTRDGDPVGIVTETDVLRVGVHTGRPFDEIAVRTAMSHPLETVGPNASVQTAVRTMKRERIKKLPVVEGLSVVGIVTATDVLYAHREFADEIRQVEQQRSEWTGSE